MAEQRYAPNELLATTLARSLGDGEVGFIGVGSSGRAFNLVVGIPLVAGRLAAASHAPDLVMQIGPLIDPDLARLPSEWNDATAYDRPGSAFIEAHDNIGALLRGGVDVAFVSGAQVDRYGNLNATWLNRPDGDRRPLIGALALTEHQAFARRTIIMKDLSPRGFVENVHFVTGVGHGPTPRDQLGLPGGGPELVLTDMATFDFNGENRQMRLISVHPGFEIQDVLDRMGFEPEIAPEVGRTGEPTDSELAAIRTEIDPNRLLLGA